MSVMAKTGREPQRLADAPRLPLGCERLWSDFLELHGSRGATGFGPMRITFADLDCWQRVNRTTLSAWEIGAIRKADDAFLASIPKGKTDG